MAIIYMKNYPSFETPESKQDEKRKIWDEKMTQMLQPDEYGYVLDKGIRDTVVALNLLEINTTQSDEGDAANSPWIQFEAPEPENYYVGEADLRAEVLEREHVQPEAVQKGSEVFDRVVQVDIWAASRDELMKAGAEYTPEFLKYVEDTNQMVERMQDFIDEYYSKNADLLDKGLKIAVVYRYDDPRYPAYLHRLPFLEVTVSNTDMPEEEKEALIAQAQSEMLRFTEYLKDRFFESEQGN